MHKTLFFHKFVCFLKYYSGESINEDEMVEELRTNVGYVKCIQNFGKYRLVNLSIIFKLTIKETCGIRVPDITIQIESRRDIGHN